MHLRKRLQRVAMLFLCTGGWALSACDAIGSDAYPVLNFRCSSGAGFTAILSRSGVELALPDRRLTMKPKPSRLGNRYESRDGTLIISEDFASLVLNTDLRFQSCRVIQPKPDERP